MAIYLQKFSIRGANIEFIKINTRGSLKMEEPSDTLALDNQSSQYGHFG